MTKEITHVDYWGEPLEVGELVDYKGSEYMVTAFTPKKVRISIRESNGEYSPGRLVNPSSVSSTKGISTSIEKAPTENLGIDSKELSHYKPCGQDWDEACELPTSYPEGFTPSFPSKKDLVWAGLLFTGGLALLFVLLGL